MAPISGVSETLLVISLIQLASSYHNIYPTIRRDGPASLVLYSRFANRILRVILASVLVASPHVHWEPRVGIVIENVILSCESLLEAMQSCVLLGRRVTRPQVVLFVFMSCSKVLCFHPYLPIPLQFAYFSFGLTVALDMLVQVGYSWMVYHVPCITVTIRYMFLWNTVRSLGILILQIIFSVLCLFPKIVGEAERETFLNAELLIICVVPTMASVSSIMELWKLVWKLVKPQSSETRVANQMPQRQSSNRSLQTGLAADGAIPENVNEQERNPDSSSGSSTNLDSSWVGWKGSEDDTAV